MTDNVLPPGPRDEIIAPGDPVYARLADAAHRGLLPGWQPVDFLRSDRLFTRRELAPLLAKLPVKTEFVALGNAPRAFASGMGWQVQATKDGITAAEASAEWQGWSFAAGRRSLRWGPGWTGGMLFSDSTAPLDRVSVTKNFGKLTFEQFYGQFFEPNDPTAPVESSSGTRRHLAGRRLTLQSEGPWQISAGEAIKALRLPDPGLAAVLPWYVYEHDWTVGGTGRWLGLPRSTAYRNSHWLNYMADVSVSYTPKNGTRFYGEYLLDDIKAPSFLGGVETTPQRSGLLLGAAASRGPLSWRAEVMDTNRRTYRSDIKADAWQRGDSPLGHVAGPNAHVLFARTDYKVSAKLSLAVEAEQRRRRDASQPGPTSLNRVTLFAATTLTPQAYATARLERDSLRLTFGWMP